ncbi:MAG: amidohydrolase, partial [Pseudomonadota bacterium]
GLFYFIGINKPGVTPERAVPNHSPRFDIDERALKVGVAAMTNLVFDYLADGDSTATAPQ